MDFHRPKDRHPNDPVETMPLPELVALCWQKMTAESVLERAGRSSIYRRYWQEAGIDAGRIRCYEDFARIPFATAASIRERLRDISPAELAGGADVRLWVSTSGTTGEPKWIPVSEKDIAGIQTAGRRLLSLVDDPPKDLNFLSLSAPAPFVSEPWLYLSFFGFARESCPSNAAIFSLSESMAAMQFARRMKSRTLFAFPSIAALIGEQTERQAATEARKIFRAKKNLRNFLAMLATRIIRVKARHIFSFRRGFFAGEPVAPYVRALKRSFNLEPSALYASTESSNVVISECASHQGMHVFLDGCLPEIIPETELERQKEDPAHRSQAVPLWNARPGLVGELVLTNFAQAFPLVRYRTADLVRVESTAPCACGRSHPRIHTLHRCDDIVNLGLIRFSTSLLQAKLAAVLKSGRILRWRLSLTREGVKPKMRLEVKSARMDSAAALRQEILERLDEIEGLSQGRKNGLIAEPEIHFIEELGDDRGHSGKDRLVVYEPAYFDGA